MSVLDLLTGDARTFREKVWASRVHRHRTDPGSLTGLLSLDDVDHLLTSTAIRTPAVRLAQDGTVLPEASYTKRASLAGRPLTGLVDPDRVLGLFAGGATVVLQGLQRYWLPLTRLVTDLELELGHPCQANAYLTPPGAQGFAVHCDTHDVFVFQTHGRKQWEVHTDRVEHVVLEPGLVMYLPTGTPHAARSESVASLHVTVGVNQLTWRTLLRRLAGDLIDQLPDGHLPAGYLTEPGALASGLGSRLADLAERVRRTDAQRVATAEKERFLVGRNPQRAGGLRDVLALADLDDHTRLRRRPGRPCELVDVDEQVRVLIGDRALSVPGWVRPALRRIRDCEELRPVDLSADLGPASRLVLCRRLVREGLLEVAPR